MSVTTTTDLWRMSATDLADAIRSRQTSSQEVIEAHLRRIEAVSDDLKWGRPRGIDFHTFAQWPEVASCGLSGVADAEPRSGNYARTRTAWH